MRYYSVRSLRPVPVLVLVLVNANGQRPTDFQTRRASVCRWTQALRSDQGLGQGSVQYSSTHVSDNAKEEARVISRVSEHQFTRASIRGNAAKKSKLLGGQDGDRL